MKKILSLLLMVSMLAAVIPFTVMASETEATSTLTEYLSYDFDTDYSEYQANCKTTYGNGNVASDKSKTENVYGIGKYDLRTSNFIIPVTTETEEITINETATTVPKGIKVEGNNLYVEMEFDYKVIDNENTTNSYTAAGVLLTGFNTSGELFSAQKTFGTIYNQVKKATDETPASAAFTSYSVTKEITDQKIADTTIGKWQRVKIVTQVTNASGNMTNSNPIQFFIDGKLVKTNYLHKDVVNGSDGKIRFVRMHYSKDGRQGLDNLTVRTYNNIADAPVDKGELVAAIRNFEADYPSYTSSDRAVQLLNAAKDTYESSTAEDADVAEAIKKIKLARNIFNAETGISLSVENDKIVASGCVSSETASDDTYRTMLVYYGNNGELLTVAMSETAKVEAGNNPVYFEADLAFSYQSVVAYVWTTNTLVPLCTTPASGIFTK